MAWAEPAFSRGDVDEAGRILVSEELVMDNEWEDALLVINNWRASHSRPLLAFRVTLTGRAKRVDQRAIIAQRLKRLSSIAIKLQRNEKMALSQMQDIGGCRAVVHTGRHVDKLVAAYEGQCAFT